MKPAKLIIDDKTIELPIISGTEDEKALDISRLRQDSGYITLDPGYGNTGSCLQHHTHPPSHKTPATPQNSFA